MIRHGGRGTSRRLFGALSEVALIAVVVALVLILPQPMFVWGWETITLGGLLAWWPPVTAGVVVLLLIRHRLPSVALLLGAALFGRFLETGVALAVISFAAQQKIRSAPRRITALAAAVALPIALAPAFDQGRYGWARVAAVVTALAMAAVVVPALLSALISQRERLVVTLRERTDYLERANRLTASEARLQERAQVASEMHDALGHRLSIISLYAGALEMYAERKAAAIANEARLLRTTAHAALEDLRGVLGVLARDQDRPIPTQTNETGTRADVQQLVDESAAAGIGVALAWTGDDLVGADASIRSAVDRVVREALTNVHKHAASTDVVVSVTVRDDRVRVDVRNGPAPAGRPGVPLPGGGRGLIGLRERVWLLGGVLDAGPTAGGGFLVRAELPVAPQPAGADPMPVPQVPADGPSAGRPAGRLTRAGLTAVSAAAGLVGVATLIVVVLTYAAVPEPLPEPHPRIGMTDREVRDRVGEPDGLAALIGQSRQPSVPDGATCWYVNGLSVDEHVVRIDRYCFVGGRLTVHTPLDIPVPTP